MISNHPAARILAQMGALSAAPSQGKAVLDSIKQTKLLDAAAEAGATFAVADIRMAAAAAVQAWCETSSADLSEGESMTDRLDALMVGIADENKDGEITDDEAAVIEIALNGAYDYMLSKGVSEEDASALLNDGDDEAAGRVCELLISSMPDGEDESMADVDAFAFDAESRESVMDSVLDAVYKKRAVVRDGKKVIISKRISGTVRLSAEQKVAIRKAGLKSRSAGARMARMKSMRARSRMGLNK